MEMEDLGDTLVLNLLVSNKLINTLLVLEFSKFINEDKQKYYKHFETMESKYVDGDCTEQIEYLLEKIYLSVKSQSNFITTNVEKSIKIWNDLNEYALKVDKKYILNYMIHMSIFDYDFSYTTLKTIQKEIKAKKIDTEKIITNFENHKIIEKLKDLNTNQEYYKLHEKWL